MTHTETPNTTHRKHALKWYYKKWVIVLTLIVFFPLGFYLIWKQPRWSKKTKKLSTTFASIILIFVITLAVIFAPPTIEVTSALSPVKGAAYTLSGTISGGVVTVNGQKVQVNNDKFSTNIDLKEGDNKITIDVIDGGKKTEQVIVIHRYTKSEIAKQKKAAEEKKRKAEEADAKKKAEAEAATKKKEAEEAAKKQKEQADAAAAAAKKQAEEAAKQPKVVLDINGSGIKQTQPFTTKNRWTIDYTFDCTNFGLEGNFQIFIKNTDDSYNTDAGANDLALNGGNTDYFYDAGEHYLTINSECDWHVIVKS